MNFIVFHSITSYRYLYAVLSVRVSLLLFQKVASKKLDGSVISRKLLSRQQTCLPSLNQHGETCKNISLLIKNKTWPLIIEMDFSVPAAAGIFTQMERHEKK